MLIVICCLLLELSSRRLEYRHHILRDQDHHHRLHDVESGQVTGRHKPATLSMLELQFVQIDGSSADFSSGCVICLDDFQKGEDCCVLSSCKHVFHSGCVKQWLDKNQSCPLCRNSV
ncbi:RING-H2 FINGER PROTEIN ATL51-LIKE [Salix koriyanagi]|uniref:RING-H2 FINGER PROTEIN ATL51-LIKE n=1 Tax=Salix koriyanagi TaxID=2511006 RepID=A0A9Q0WZ79_9ROSI|nr:RING-H2 FINGER PROTEIN ATL51-LIKE [Salix koriyanagi]